MSAQPRRTPSHKLIEGLLKGDRLALSRAISRVEDDAAAAAEIIGALFAHTGKAHLIGITGAPGTGKSTLAAALVESYREAGLTVAVLAVDPTSPLTGGALLGDRVRMMQHSGDAGVFIRSMATRGGVGGLARASAEAALLLDAAGFDRILIETVGAGQTEVEIAGAAHSVVVVEAPGMGDEVQAIKAGLLETADVFAVNKADRKGAARAAAALKMMLETGSARTILHHGQAMTTEAAPAANGECGWSIPVLKTVAVSAGGVAELRDALEMHRQWLRQSGQLAAREKKRLQRMVQTLVQAELQARLERALSAGLRQETLARLQRREIDPYSAASGIMAKLPPQ